MIYHLPERIRRWWFINVIGRHVVKKASVNLRRDYNNYTKEAHQMGILALSYADWCGVTSLPVDIDYNKLAHNLAVGLYPVCACGDWMHQHRNFSGKCQVCQGHLLPENCQNFRFSHYGRPVEGFEKHVAIAFNQAIYECE